MLLSRLLMIFALAILAYLVWITMTGPDKAVQTTSAVAAAQQTNVTTQRPNVTNAAAQQTNAAAPQTTPRPAEHMNNIAHVSKPIEQFNNINQAQAPVYVEKIVYEPQQHNAPEQFVNNKSGVNINYEAFQENVSGVADIVRGAAPFGGKQEVYDDNFATVKYSGLVDANPGDVIQIEGTDLLTAPLVDNMLYTNSIANTNRNASNDLRGDIPLQFNDTYTPFYSSVIYGAPLSQKQMTISKI